MNGSPEAKGALHDEHRAGLAERHSQVLARIRAACLDSGRPPGSVRLLAVSKTFDAAQVLALLGLGQQAFGENYVQEALGKMAACQAADASQPETTRAPAKARLPEWHFIGPIQSNKTKPIAEHFDWVHSVDRAKIASRLGEQRPATLPPLQCCVQVNVSGEVSKSGCTPQEALDVAQVIFEQPRLQLRGIMAIPEPTSDTAIQRRRFALAREVLEQIRNRLGVDAKAIAMADSQSRAVRAVDTLSMGMSADLETAIAEGATIVRVGSAIFGERPRKLPQAGGR